MLLPIIFSCYVTVLLGQRVGASVPDETGPGRPYLEVAASATALGALAIAAYAAGSMLGMVIVALIAVFPLLLRPPAWYRLGIVGAALSLLSRIPEVAATVLVLALCACFLEGTLARDLKRLALHAILLPVIALAI